MEQQQFDKASDEIDLIDLIRVLVKRWRTIVVITMLTTIVGVALCFVLPQKYDVKTMIQIGQIASLTNLNGSPKLIEDPVIVKSKIEDVYLPLARKEVAKLPDNQSLSTLKVAVKIPKNSDLLVLLSQVSSIGIENVARLHQLIIDRVVKDHGSKIQGFLMQNKAMLAQENLQLEKLKSPLALSLIKQRAQTAIDNAQNELLTLKENGLVLQQHYANLKQRKELLAAQVTQLQKSLQASIKNRISAAREVKNESVAMTLLLLDNSIEKDRTRLVDMQDRLLFQFEENAKKLEAKLADNARKSKLQINKVAELKDDLTQGLLDVTYSQKVQEQKINNLKGQIEQLRNTKPLAGTLTSEKPVSPKKPLIVALAFILGLMGSVMLVFLLEYLQQHRQQLD